MADGKVGAQAFGLLVTLIFHNYDQFDARPKGVVPLRRVCVPEVIEGTAE